MRNNKSITIEDVRVGLRIKIALPTFYAFHSSRKDMHKKYSWWKGKIVEVKPKYFVVHTGSYLGRFFVPYNKIEKIIKCL